MKIFKADDYSTWLLREIVANQQAEIAKNAECLKLLDANPKWRRESKVIRRASSARRTIIEKCELSIAIRTDPLYVADLLDASKASTPIIDEILSYLP